MHARHLARFTNSIHYSTEASLNSVSAAAQKPRKLVKWERKGGKKRKSCEKRKGEKQRPSSLSQRARVAVCCRWEKLASETHKIYNS